MSFDYCNVLRSRKFSTIMFVVLIINLLILKEYIDNILKNEPIKICRIQPSKFLK